GARPRPPASSGRSRAGWRCALSEAHNGAFDLAGGDVGHEALQGGAVHVAAGEAAVVVALRQAGPALVLLAGDKGLAGLTLGGCHPASQGADGLPTRAGDVELDGAPPERALASTMAWRSVPVPAPAAGLVPPLSPVLVTKNVAGVTHSSSGSTNGRKRRG